jgi:hypothetical protein
MSQSAEITQEVLKAIAKSNDGVWMPIAIIGGALSLIIVLLLFIYNLQQKGSNKRHFKSEETLTNLEKNQTELRILSQKYDTTLTSHQGQISDNRRNINTLQGNN